MKRGTVWMGSAALCLAGCQAAPDGTKHVQATFPETDAPGYAVLVDACAACHAPPHPEAHSAREWPWVVQRMESHRIQRGLGAITERERKALLSYLRRHAGKPT